MSASSSAISTGRLGTSAPRDTPIDLDPQAAVTANISVVGTLWGPKRPRIPTGRGTELKPPTVWVRIPPGARRTSQTVAAGATAPAATFRFVQFPVSVGLTH